MPNHLVPVCVLPVIPVAVEHVPSFTAQAYDSALKVIGLPASPFLNLLLSLFVPTPKIHFAIVRILTCYSCYGIIATDDSA